MVLKVTVEGNMPVDCPHVSDISALKKSMADVVRRRLDLRPEDIVEIVFK